MVVVGVLLDERVDVDVSRVLALVAGKEGGVRGEFDVGALEKRWLVTGREERGWLVRENDE